MSRKPADAGCTLPIVENANSVSEAIPSRRIEQRGKVSKGPSPVTPGPFTPGVAF
jgi:hypothetical protein